MLTLNVCRHNDKVLDPKNPETLLFYDEKLTINLDSSRLCQPHLYVTVMGSLQDREREHSLVLHDEDLKFGKSWSQAVHLRHPRSPLQNPHLEIVVTAHYASDDVPEEAVLAPASNKYLVPFQPIASSKSSFLVPFSPTWDSSKRDATAEKHRGHNRALTTVSGIDFDEAHEERRGSTQTDIIAPPPAAAEHTYNGVPHDAKEEIIRWKVPLAQALELEIRSLRPALERDRVIAEIDLVSGAHNVRVLMRNVELEDGLADLMGTELLPITLGRQGKYAMCYNLQLRAATQPSSLPVSRKPLNLSLECEVLVGPENSDSNPRISTSWTPIVDFEGTQGPLPKTPALNLPLNSPLVPSFSSTSGIGGGASTSTLDLVAGPRQNSSANLSLMGGVSIIITGPQFVKTGEVFEWNFKIMNRSQRNRLFTITFGSAFKEPLKREPPLPSDSLQAISQYNPELLRRRAASHYRATGANRGIAPLCQELRVGSLAPHVCFETKIELYALKTGTHTIEAARIEDLTNRDSYDIGSLLEVIVLPNA